MFMRQIAHGYNHVHVGTDIMCLLSCNTSDKRTHNNVGIAITSFLTINAQGNRLV